MLGEKRNALIRARAEAQDQERLPVCFSEAFVRVLVLVIEAR
jgi:hypothetical protein